MQEYDQIVIGRGASALGFLHYAKQAGTFKATSTLVVGRNDLWGNVAAKDPGHRFGQPAQIVSVASPPGQAATVDSPTFQSAKDISGGLRELEKSLAADKSLSFMDADVTQVTRGGIGYVVNLSKPQRATAQNIYGSPFKVQVAARRVIVATGFGPSSRPPVSLPAEIANALAGGLGDWRRQVMGGTEYLYSAVNVPTHGEFAVAVQGSSATSSWAVLRALALGAKRIYWISRSGFGDANPAGRNSDVLDRASKNGWLINGSVKTVATRGARILLTLSPAAAKAAADTTKGTLGQAYKKWYTENAHSAANKRMAALNPKIANIDKDTQIVVDHYVYALGADPKLPGGAQQILGETLTGEMKPVFDVDKRFGDVEAETTVAMRNDKGDLWLVGAAVFRSLGLKNDVGAIGDSFKNIAQMMCEAGTPPEGIAAVMASLKAVTGYVDQKINLQTADFKEIERWVTNLYLQRTGHPISAKTRRGMTDQIVALRKHTVFGLSKQEVDDLSDPGNEFWDEMFAVVEGTDSYRIDHLASFA